MLLHGPFVGGAYFYIDPTPSKNALELIPDVVPRNMGTIPAGARDERGLHLGGWNDVMNAA